MLGTICNSPLHVPVILHKNSDFLALLNTQICKQLKYYSAIFLAYLIFTLIMMLLSDL